MFPEPTPPAGAIHILLLDDEPSVLLALKLLLQALGFRVSDFCEVEAALKFLSDGQACDLFICDLRMPRYDGLTVLEQSKRIRPGLPFVLMSGLADDEESAKARRKGASGFLAKPFKPEEVKALVQQCTATAAKI